MAIDPNTPWNAVEQPQHYTFADPAYEVRKVIRAWDLNWHLGSAVKYIPRAGKKDPAKYVEDLRKAIQYLQFEIDEVTGATNAKT